MKFGLLIGYNKKNNFLEKSYTKCGGETFPNLSPKKPKLSVSPSQLSKFLYSLLAADHPANICWS